MSYERLLNFLHSGEIAGVQRGRTWSVDRAAVEVGVAAHRLVAGTLGPTTTGRPRRNNLATLQAVLALPGWNIERLADHLGLLPGKVTRWTETGPPNFWVPKLREVLDDPDR